MYNTNTTEVKRNLSVSMLTSDTLYRLAWIMSGNRYTVLSFPETEAKSIEHLAYCANMGAESKEAAWIRFCELCLSDLNGKYISEEVKERIGCALNLDRYEVRTFNEDGDNIELNAYKTAEFAEYRATDRVYEAQRNNEAIRVILVDTDTDEVLYEAQTIGTAYRYCAEYRYYGEYVYAYNAEEAAQAYADYIGDSVNGKEAYDDMLDDCYEGISIGDLCYCPSRVLEAVDPIAYHCGLTDWADNEYKDCVYDLERLDYGEKWERYGWECDLVRVAEERTNGGEWVTI